MTRTSSSSRTHAAPRKPATKRKTASARGGPKRTRRPAKTTRSATPPSRRWSKGVTEHSDSLDLEPNVFKRGPRAIALSLKRSAERSSRRKSAPYRSAMSMLTFYENRAGRNLSARQKQTLERAKDELRKLFDKV
jgi:hypothetical protein